MAAETTVKVDEATLVAEVAEAIHDLFQPIFLGDLIVQHLADQLRILGIGRVPQRTDPFDYVSEFLYYILVVIHVVERVGYQSVEFYSSTLLNGVIGMLGNIDFRYSYRLSGEVDIANRVAYYSMRTLKKIERRPPRNG